METLLEVKNVFKYYGDRPALLDVSFSVSRGEVVGFLGPNGSGKTTTMRIITGFMPPSTGSIKVCGFDVVEKPIEAKRRIGYLPENPPLYAEMTVEGYLKFVGRIKGLASSKLRERTEFVIEKCGLTEVRKRILSNLSRGYKQRVGLAQAIIHNPEVLLLDEPTVGLDPQQIVEVRNLVKELSQENTVVLSTHVLYEVTRICSRVIMLSAGKIVASEDIKQLSDKVKEEYRLFISVSSDGQKAYSTLKSVPSVRLVERLSEKEFRVISKEDVRENVVKTLVQNDIMPIEIYEEKPSLEDVYLRIISGQQEA